MTSEEKAKKAAGKRRRGKGKNFSLWLSPEQKNDLLDRAEAAAASSPSFFIKSRIFDEEIIPVKKVSVKQADPELVRQLAWLGNNLNQIARVVNQSKQLSKANAAGIFSALALIAEELEIMNQQSIS